MADRRCSFCSRPEEQAGFLTIGPGDVCICHDCALLAIQMTGAAKRPQGTTDHGLSSAPDHGLTPAPSPLAEEILSLMLQRLALGVEGAIETQGLWRRFKSGEADARRTLMHAYLLVGIALLTIVGDPRWSQAEKQSVVTEFNVALGSFLDDSIEEPAASAILDLVNRVVRKFRM
jgi:hypothetical protein